ncbi:ComEC/Rec2 family competence protein [soil metagenome]
MKAQPVSFMIILRRIPLIRLLFPCVAGIIVALQIGDIHVNPFYLALISLFLIVPVFYNPLSRIYRWRYISGIFINVFFFICGYNLILLKSENLRPDFFNKIPGDEYLVYLNDAPILKEKTIKVIGKVFAIKNGIHINKALGNWLIYFEKDSLSLLLNYGDRIFLSVKPAEIPPPSIPGEFDYKTFLANRQIFYRAYVRSDNWKKLSGKDGNPVIAYSLQTRNKLVEKLYSKLKAGQEFAVASALTVGYTDAIDPELMSAFSSSGTLHILSVSGMHVGVIYLMLAWMLGFLQKNKFWKHLYFPLILSLIWAYAILSGCSASVLRSAMMLSLVITGKWISEKSPILNTLAASMFLLLCYNPFMLTDLGFQLSYLAVLGIVIVHPMVVKQFEMPNALLHRIWELTAVSISAQLTTAPISLFYFHQFPNLFIPANLIIIPLSTLAIYGSILLMVFSSAPVISDWIAVADSSLLKIMNYMVMQFENFPAAVTSGISISLAECLLSYGLIIAFLNWVNTKSVNYFAGMLIFSLSISGLQLRESILQRNQFQIIQYPIQQHSAYGIIRGRSHILFADSALVADQKLQKRMLSPFWTEKGVVNVGAINLK